MAPAVVSCSRRACWRSLCLVVGGRTKRVLLHSNNLRSRVRRCHHTTTTIITAIDRCRAATHGARKKCSPQTNRHSFDPSSHAPSPVSSLRRPRRRSLLSSLARSLAARRSLLLCCHTDSLASSQLASCAFARPSGCCCASVFLLFGAFDTEQPLSVHHHSRARRRRISSRHQDQRAAPRAPRESPLSNFRGDRHTHPQQQATSNKLNNS